MAPEVMRLATPVILGNLGWTVQTLVDTWMLGRLGGVSVAAAGAEVVAFRRFQLGEEIGE